MRLGDAEIRELRTAQQLIQGSSLVDSVAAVRLLLSALGIPSRPSRAAPRPRFLQDYAKHESFAHS